MAGSAVLRRGLVDEHRLGSDHFGQLVAFGAAHVLVRAAQGKRRSLFMVKEGRLPLHAGVALSAARDVIFSKLLSVDVLVAVLALAGRRLEVHVHQFGFKIGRLMAIDARGRTVRAEQGELCLGVVEA